MKILYHGEFITLNEGDEVFIGRCGSGHTLFGEPGKFVGTTNRHMIFKSASGKTVKTAIYNIWKVSTTKFGDIHVIPRPVKDYYYDKLIAF